MNRFAARFRSPCEGAVSALKATMHSLGHVFLTLSIIFGVGFNLRSISPSRVGILLSAAAVGARSPGAAAEMKASASLALISDRTASSMSLVVNTLLDRMKSGGYRPPPQM